MLHQRSASAGPAVLLAAEALPFPGRAFDAALATLTLHHWLDVERGLQEMARVATRQVILFFDPASTSDLWLVGEYFPEILDLGTERAAPDGALIASVLAVERIEVVPVPADCQDGFAGSYWNRPEAYLDPSVQAGMSCFAQLDPEVVRRGADRLRRDLENGTWDARHGELRAMSEIDIGYRLLVAGHLS
jgi:SAM-dependent methyltransferase